MWSIEWLLVPQVPPDLSVRPEVVRLFIGVEYSRVRSIAWDMPYHIVTTRTEVGLVNRRKLPDRHWEGLQ